MAAERKKEYALAVIGGGASGLAAAVRAARLQQAAGQPVSVLVLEGGRKPGRRILATGNGKCNLTNMNADVFCYHGDSRLAARVLQAWPPARVRDWFSSLGLLTKADDMGRVYPCCGQASAVLQCLCAAAEEAGAVIRSEAPVRSISRRENGFTLQCETETFLARRVIVAAGGIASPKLGCGDAASLVKELGHSVTPRLPALVRLLCPDIPAELKGVRVKTEVTLLADGRPAASAEGEAIFGAGSVSGICVMQLSRLAAVWKAQQTVMGEPCRALSLSLDLLPGMEEAALSRWLAAFAAEHPTMPAQRLLDGVLPSPLSRFVLQSCGVAGAAGNVNRKTCGALAHKIKHFVQRIADTGGWDDAQVTAGGVPLKELFLPSMESKCCPGLYITGELCNVDGDCGGFNLQWAWATGLLAGEAAVKTQR